MSARGFGVLQNCEKRLIISANVLFFARKKMSRKLVSKMQKINLIRPFAHELAQ